MTLLTLPSNRFSGPAHPYTLGKAPRPPPPSSFTSPEACQHLFPHSELRHLEFKSSPTIYLPKAALEQVLNLFKNIGSQRAQDLKLWTAKNIQAVLDQLEAYPEAFDVVFGCLLYGFIELDGFGAGRYEGRLQRYQSKGRKNTTAVDLNLVIDSMILADNIGAPPVVHLLGRVLDEEFSDTIPTIEHFKAIRKVPWATNAFLGRWMFAWDEKGKMSKEAVELHHDRLEQALKEVNGLAELAMGFIRGGKWHIAPKAGEGARKILGVEKSKGTAATSNPSAKVPKKVNFKEKNSRSIFHNDVLTMRKALKQKPMVAEQDEELSSKEAKMAEQLDESLSKILNATNAKAGDRGSGSGMVMRPRAGRALQEGG
jgi:hypothetical protein